MVSKVFSIRNFVIKQMMKAGDDGIMKMPSNMKADFGEAVLIKELIDAGIDPKLIKNEQQLVNVLDGIQDMRKQMSEMAIQESKGITSAKIMDMKGKEIPKGSKIMGGEAVETEAEIAARMNRENKLAVQNLKIKKEYDKAVKEGKFKGTEEDFRNKIDMMMDDIDNDFAKGGRVGLFKGAVAGGGNISPGTDTKGNVRDDNPFTGGGGGDDPKPIKKKILPAVKSTIKKLYNTGQELSYLKNLATGNFPGITKQLLFDLGKRKLLDPAANTLFPEGDLQEIKMNAPDQRTYNIEATKDMVENLPGGLLKDIVAPAGALVMSPFYDAGQAITRMEPNSGIAGFMEAYDAENPISSAVERFTGASAALAERLNKADGGRIGLKDGMDRRTFMKVMAGLASIPVVGKLFKGAKVASKATPKVMENFSTTLPEPPTYFLKLVDKITKQGRPTTSTEDIMETYIYTGKNGDSYELVNDLKTGDLRITKDKSGIGTYGHKSFDTIEDRTVMEYKAPREDVDIETGRGTKEQGEYEEYRVEFDQDGTEAGADAIEELVQKEIIEESASEAPSIKKADGGRVGLLSGGGILRTIISNLAKSRNIKPSEYLKTTNYKALPDSAKRIISKEDFLKLKSDMTEKRIEMMENIRDMIETRQGFEKSKAELAAGMNKAAPGYGDEAVKMMFPENKFPSPVPAGSGQKDVMMMEQLIKNLKTKDRQLNASGGVAYMLGE